MAELYRARFAVDLDKELRAAFRPRFMWLSGVVFNLAVAVVALFWVVLNRHTGVSHAVHPLHGLYHRVVNRLHPEGTAGLFITSWLLSDVISTNLLGTEVDRGLSLFERRGSVGQVLLIRVAMLGIVASAIGVVASIVGEWVTSSWTHLPRDVLLSLAPVLLWMGLGSMVSVLLPVRQLTLVDRWRDRHTWLRWGTSLVLPLALASATLPVLAVPLRWAGVIAVSDVERLRLSGVVAVDLWAAAMCLVLCAVAMWVASVRAHHIATTIWQVPARPLGQPPHQYTYDSGSPTAQPVYQQPVQAT